MVFRFCTCHGIVTTIIWAKFQNDPNAVKVATIKWDFVRFQYKVMWDGIGVLQRPQVTQLGNQNMYDDLENIVDLHYFRRDGRYKWLEIDMN